jgi:Importin-beta N-terminal domain
VHELTVKAEAQLKKEAETRPDFLENLLTLIATPQEPIPIRQAAALFFKNFVRQNWKVCASLSRAVLTLG